MVIRFVCQQWLQQSLPAQFTKEKKIKTPEILFMIHHIGEKIKEELYNQEIPVSVFARRIGRSRNSVYDLFERSSVDMKLLTKISAVLKYDFVALYTQPKYASPENTTSLAEPGNQHLQEHINLLEQKIELLELECKLLKKELSFLKTALK
jgi:transcriptional regulator with XRE-family HTH domain